MAEFIEREALIEACHWVIRSDGTRVYVCHAEDIENAPKADVAPVRHGRWTCDPDSGDGFAHHMCTACKTNAIFDYTYEDDYDEWLDGEWRYVGQREAGILEHLTGFCPNCGAKMDLEAQHD